MTDASETGVLNDGCSQCGHAFSPHVIVATEHGMVANTEIPVGGVMLCPECDCAATWSVDGHPHPEMPSPGKLALIRESVIG